MVNSLQGNDGVIAGTELYSEEILSQLPNLKVISRLGVGMDNIDLEFAKSMGLKVYKSTTTPALAVAELTLGLILNLLRKINVQNTQLKSGVWKKQMGELFTGKTLGIVGMGNIGKQLVKLLSSFKSSSDTFRYSYANRIWILLNLEMWIRSMLEENVLNYMIKNKLYM